MLKVTKREIVIPRPEPEMLVVMEMDELTAKAVKLALYAAGGDGHKAFQLNPEGRKLVREVSSALSEVSVYYDDKRIASF